MKTKVFLIFVFILLANFWLDAQCPMCRMSVESNMQNGTGASIGSTINTGILYMLAMPYLLVGTLGYIWYKNKKKQELLILEEDEKARLN